MEIPAKTADTLRPHRSPCEITCKELLQKFHTNSITRSTILVKTFGILCVSGPPPPPPEQCWVLQVKHFLHILHWRKILLRPCLWVCVSPPSCKIHRKTREKGEVSQNLLARIVGSASDWIWLVTFRHTTRLTCTLYPLLWLKIKIRDCSQFTAELIRSTPRPGYTYEISAVIH